MKLRCRVDDDVHEQLTDAVVWMQGRGEETSLSREVESAIRARLAILRRRHGRRDGFPKRGAARVRVGRPPKQ